MTRNASWTLAVVLTVLAGVQSVQAWAGWQQTHATPGGGALAPGAVCSVMLTNGQIYYGVYDGNAGGAVRLHDVYYVQAVVDPDSHQSNNRLMNRRKTDWHAPEWMVIPTDKVLFMETVGPDSRLSQLMAQDRKANPS